MNRTREPGKPSARNVVNLDKQRNHSAKTEKPNAMSDDGKMQFAFRSYMEREMLKLETMIMCCQKFENCPEILEGQMRRDILLDMSHDISGNLRRKFDEFCSVLFNGDKGD